MSTPQDFINLLPIVANRGWRVMSHGRIRDKDGRCPVCALVHEVSAGKVDWFTLARTAMSELLGEPAAVSDSSDGHDAIGAVMRAADGKHRRHRAALMAALGMKP